MDLFTGGGKPSARPSQPAQPAHAARDNGSRPTERPSRKPEAVEVTTPRLYVGNLSFDATESDLFELFNGVGAVQNAEVVTYRHNQRSKGFAFVQMLTVDEAKRAVEELHDKEFLGRKLVVSGAKSSEHHSAN
ncbi:MAG TPA: RNA-binding protein [Chthoniobacterales bacterium]|jgi:RNA recognition motif-containing protein